MMLNLCSMGSTDSAQWNYTAVTMVGTICQLLSSENVLKQLETFQIVQPPLSRFKMNGQESVSTFKSQNFCDSLLNVSFPNRST